MSRGAMAAILAGCFVWTMIVVGLSFAMVEKGAAQWWVIPLFGAAMPAIAVLAVRRVPVAVPPKPAPEPTELLSPRELEVLRHLAAGHSNSEIAKALFLAPGTVKAHLNHIFRKLGATSRLQAVAHAREAGLLD
ncbi:response regulator transcription factor [Actinoplanes sp. CA-131856]